MFRQLMTVAALVAVLAAPAGAFAFCGFFVGSASEGLYNDASRVVLMREGKTTVVSMQNQYRGPTEDFALVVPVPEVLKKEDVKTLNDEIFEKVDRLSAPRLVQYWEQDPCGSDEGFGGLAIGGGGDKGAGFGASGRAKDEVVVEAQFEVGEYDIVILSSNASGALEKWLVERNYKIPEGAAQYFEPYVASGSYFFVAKVDPERVTFENGEALLSPLRFHYEDEDFRLPVRLGLINSAGKQDLLVYILARDQRFEVANYPNEFIPTNLEVSEEVKENFPAFYESVFSRVIEESPKAIVTEYAWPAGNGKCDPCPPGNRGLGPEDLTTLGTDVVGALKSARRAARQMPTVEGPLPTAVVRRVVRFNLGRVRDCFRKDPSAPPFEFSLNFVIERDGSLTNVEIEGDLPDDELKSCVVDNFAGAKFPEPAGEGRVKVIYPFSKQFTAQLAGNFGAVNQWILTRLHARYDADSLGEDLVFKKAEPMSGGRPTKEPQYGAIDSAWNAFQARYIIRHEWKGAVECDDPQFGRWDGPPSGAEPRISTADGLTTGEAPAPVDLASMVKKGPGKRAAPEVEETEPPKQEPVSKQTSSSCECSAAHTSPPFGWLVVLAIFVALRGRRRD